MVFVFSNLETKEDALRLVKAMRMGRSKRRTAYEPAGLRLCWRRDSRVVLGPHRTAISAARRYLAAQSARGLLVFATIETELGLRNMDEIAQVPGIGLLYFTSGGDSVPRWVCRSTDPAISAAA